MARLKKNIVRAASLLVASLLVTSTCCESVRLKDNGNLAAVSSERIVKRNGLIKTNQEDFYDENVVYTLPETIAQNDEISVIVTMDTDSVIDVYREMDTKQTLSEFASSTEARKITASVANDRKLLIDRLNASGISYKLGEKYDTVLSGFEIMIKARDFEKTGKLLEDSASLMIGEVYEPAYTEVVTNQVDVYDTGIFKGEASGKTGEGVVVAVLDTGLDYTHSAFSEETFLTSTGKEPKQAFSKDYVKGKVALTEAAKTTNGLTVEDVYMSKKVPFAYDYADKDPDVLPIDSEHGTHVAGIIAGEDDQKTPEGLQVIGVAPKAQLAIMKVFSDTQQGAKDSWLMAALEDCVTLGVDVINMSLGSGCGFAREEDQSKANEVYDSIREAGISLICAAANDYNATFGSEKNGSLGLTSNPDSGTVGSPSTYAAPLSVASVDGVKTPYLLYNGEIMYFNEASTSDAKTKDFVADILKTQGNVDSYEFEYVTIPGIGRSSDYPEENEFYHGKIVLVKRGTSTFEDKVRIALKDKGAAGIIIYNNVSGTISMSVGADVGAVCSISQDEGEKLAAAGTGKLLISRKNVAGPFMSDFSSWGPTSDLQIKPEITAHGGEILSAVPGGRYDRLSGTSMAAPNQAGAAALIREYVKYSGNFGEYGKTLDALQVTDIVNQLTMSTADILMNKNGLPYAVRKQGAGLVNIEEAVKTNAYLTTFDKNGELMDKSKLELGDDKDRTGVYTMTFAINNITGNAVSYDISSWVQTEGVSETFTNHGDTTVTQDGYHLDGAQTTVLNVTNGTQNGSTVTVGGNQTATVKVQIVLSDSDKQYLNDSFEYGMYVEGFIKLKAGNGANTDLNLPLLAFYGDWTEAPIFDEEYYDTHKDEINAGLNPEDKLMADAYATRAIGGLYSDYIATLGTYYFVQNPAATQIAASKEHIAISNQADEKNATISSIRSISAGMLRNAKEVNIVITEDATGKVIFNRTEINQKKSSSRGSTVYQSNIDVEFSTLEHKLKNNTRYTVSVEAFIDYGSKADQKNVRNKFEFPVYIDFQAPVVQDVVYRTEYDQSTKKTHLYADLQVYDNHYAMGMQIGQIVLAKPGSGYTYSMNTFGKYMTPIYSSYNSTSTVTVELTDYVARLKQSAGMDHVNGDWNTVVENNNSFIAICYDYAMNSATYEIRLPDEILAMNFSEEEVSLSPNETLDLKTILEVYPEESWKEILDFSSDNKAVADVDGQTLVAKASGEAWITAKGYKKNGELVEAKIKVTVLSEGDEGYVNYDVPSVNNFTLTGYKVNKAYYSVSVEDREIGLTDGTYDFGGSYSLSMFPSENVTLQYKLDSSYRDRTNVTFSVGNSRIATITEDGVLEAKEKGTTIVSVAVSFDGQPTFYSERVTVTVKDPYTTMGMSLTSYKGLGGEVEIPSNRGITVIGSYAFSNYEYVPKDLDAGDVIDKEDPYFIKQMYIGDKTIKKITIPAEVTTIEAYAFANLTALEEVVIKCSADKPCQLTKIGLGAFKNCTSLKKINLEHVQFINKEAFAECALEDINLQEAVAIGDYAFRSCPLNSITLKEKARSLGVGAFYNNDHLTSVTIDAKTLADGSKDDKIKVGTYAFADCEALEKIDINADVLPAYCFYNCKNLSDVTLGPDVAVIGEYAFARTAVRSFKLRDGQEQSSKLSLENGGAHLLKGDELIMVAPASTSITVTTNASSISAGAFAGNTKIITIKGANVKHIGDYAFADCSSLTFAEMNGLETIGKYAFAGTLLEQTPNLEAVRSIGDYAFAGTKLKKVEIAENTHVGKYAFGAYEIMQDGKPVVRHNDQLTEVTVHAGTILEKGAFESIIYLYTYEETGLINKTSTISETKNNYKPYTYVVEDGNGGKKQYEYLRYDFNLGVKSNLKTVVIEDNVTLGESAFAGHAKMTSLTLGDNVRIGDYAFFNAKSLTKVSYFGDSSGSVDGLSGVTKIGKGAFSGTTTLDYFYQFDDLKKENPQSALIKEFVDGEEVSVGYKYTSYAPAFTKADLSSLVDEKTTDKDGKPITIAALGENAFAWNKELTSITFGDGVTVISAYAFANCEKLTTLTLPAQIDMVGDYAFYQTAISEMDLTNVAKVGDYAFSGTKLTTVALKEGASIGQGAFAECEKLATVENLDKAVKIGAEAFAETALTEVTLSAAEEIGDFAFGNSKVTKVSFGESAKERKLVLGENPFYGCQITTYGREEDIPFKVNGVSIGTQLVETYDVGATIKVIDGVLYQTVKNGASLELVSFPVEKEADDYVVVEGTVRITAKAFADSGLRSVTLPSTLLTIGDKAFYGCENLAIVTFKSYNAPTLEEAYDPLYPSYETLPFTGKLGTYEGLGISPYYMWNATSGWTNFYFGANFVDYVGQTKGNLVMVRPANGQNYNSFIFSQYFGTTVNGLNAATDATLNLIARIEKLPSLSILKLTDKGTVTAVRSAFNMLTEEQQALVTNLDKLKAAEDMIVYLENQGQTTDEPVATEPKDGLPTYVIILIVIGGVAILAVGGFFGYRYFIKAKKSKEVAEEIAETEETKVEDVAETAETVVEATEEDGEAAEIAETENVGFENEEN